MRAQLLTAVMVLMMLAPGTPSAGQPRSPSRCFELRTYTVAPGKLEALHRRFQDHAMALFKKHGVEVVAFWMPADRPDTVMYMLAHPSCEAAPAAWKAFFDDPAWIAARDASEKNGPLVTKVEKVFMTPTPYSPLK
jgi:NIPSNAP